MTDVFLNEKFIGTVENSKEFIKQLRNERRKGSLNQDVNFFYDEEYDEFYVDTTKGRARRPLIVVENGKSLLTDAHIKGIEDGTLKIEKIVKDGIIEYIDAGEEENCYIAL